MAVSKRCFSSWTGWVEVPLPLAAPIASTPVKDHLGRSYAMLEVQNLRFFSDFTSELRHSLIEHPDQFQRIKTIQATPYFCASFIFENRQRKVKLPDFIQKQFRAIFFKVVVINYNYYTHERILSEYLILFLRLKIVREMKEKAK